jgi:hypothetical protein
MYLSFLLVWYMKPLNQSTMAGHFVPPPSKQQHSTSIKKDELSRVAAGRVARFDPRRVLLESLLSFM